MPQLQVSRDAFELQNNALDNCAAACVCKSWQTAVNSSFVSVLHLHIHDGPSLHSCLAHWCAYLAARTSIGELKLTAGDMVEHAVQSGVVKHLTLIIYGLHSPLPGCYRTLLWTLCKCLHAQALASCTHQQPIVCCNGIYTTAVMVTLNNSRNLSCRK